MTISSETRKAGPSVGNGATTVFPFAFKVFLASDLAVILTTLATGVQQSLVLNTDYTVALNPDQNANPGGSVTYNPLGVPMPATQSLTIGSVVTKTQGTHITNGGAFLANNIEDMVDRVTIEIQQEAEKVTRSLKFPIVDGALTSELPAAAQRANTTLGFDAVGNVLAGAVATALVSAAMIPVVQAVNVDAARALLLVSGRNPVINGCCRVAQRAATALSTTPTYGQVDRHMLWASGGAVSAGSIVQQAVTWARSGKTVRSSGTTLTGAGVLSWKHRIESLNAVEWANKNCVFSARVQHDTGAPINYTIICRKPTVVDNYGATTPIVTSAVISVPSGTPTLISLPAQAMGDITNGLEIEVQAACGAVVTKNFDFGDIQLEAGAAVTDFEPRSYGLEFALCQRYLPRFVWGANAKLGTGQAYSTTQVMLPLKFPVPTRVAPTGITASAVANFAVGDASLAYGGAQICNAVSFDNASPTDGSVILATAGASVVAGNASTPQSRFAGTFIQFEGCEL